MDITSFRKNVSLRDYTTLKIGGAAEYFFDAHSIEELRDAVLFAKKENIPLRVIGGGSNILAPDDILEGLLVHSAYKGIEFIDQGDLVEVIVSAGEVFDAVVERTVQEGLWGLENLSAIPGLVGATPIQNVGAYGVEVADRILWVEYMDREGVLAKRTKEECNFSYRDSLFKRDMRDAIITQIAFGLTKESERNLTYKDLKEYFVDVEAPSQQEIRNAVIRIRSKKFPDWSVIGTAGSFFKNPFISRDAFTRLKEKYPALVAYEAGTYMKVSLGYMLDKILGLKGYRVGDVGLYEQQALVLVNYGNATAHDVEIFANDIAKRVKEISEINIEWEVTRF